MSRSCPGPNRPERCSRHDLSHGRVITNHQFSNCSHAKRMCERFGWKETEGLRSLISGAVRVSEVRTTPANLFERKRNPGASADAFRPCNEVVAEGEEPGMNHPCLPARAVFCPVDDDDGSARKIRFWLLPGGVAARRTRGKPTLAAPGSRPRALQPGG